MVEGVFAPFVEIEGVLDGEDIMLSRFSKYERVGVGKFAERGESGDEIGERRNGEEDNGEETAGV